MSRQAVDPKSLDRYLLDMLIKYTNEVVYEISIAVNEVGFEARDRVAKLSPARTGKYKRGWKVDFKNQGYRLTCVIHQNNKNYRLIHLLEKGHAIKNTGRRTSPIEHVKPVRDWAEKELERRIREAVK